MALFADERAGAQEQRLSARLLRPDMPAHHLIGPMLIGLMTLSLGCASAPKVQESPLNWALPSAWQSEHTAGAIDSLWVSNLADSTLTALVQEAVSSNWDMKLAAARMTAAMAQARMAGAPLWPQAQVAGSSSRRRQNFIGFPIPGGSSNGLTSTTTNNGVNLNLSWEVDLWGRLRAGEAAALADVLASRADLRAARLSLAAQTARAYFAVIESRGQLELARESLDNQLLALAQIRQRYERGLRPSLDLRLGRSAAAAAEAALHQRDQLLDFSRRQLESLLGRYPGASLRAGAQLPQLSATVPVGLPSELIRRRPDLVAAERRLAAADSRLAQAQRALYPRISLTASGGRSSEQLGDLLKGDFSVWNLAANLTQPLFQGGRLRGGVELAESGVDGAVAAFAQSVLRALGEVEVGLAAEGYLALQEAALATAANEALAARGLAEDRYQRGLSDLITMLESQRRAFDAQSRLLAIRRQRLDNRLDLHLALGGRRLHSENNAESLARERHRSEVEQ